MEKLSLFQQIRDCSVIQQQLIATVLVQRMLPNYSLFSELTQFASVQLPEDLMDLLWKQLIQKKPVANWLLQVDKLAAYVPDERDFDLLGVYPASDAITALVTLIELHLETPGLFYTDIAKLSQGTITRLIELEHEQALPSEQIKQHPLMAYELYYVQQLLEQVAVVEQITPTVITEFQQFAIADGQTNIGLSLE